MFWKWSNQYFADKSKMAANFKLYFFALWYNKFIYVYDVRIFLSKDSSYGQLN